MTIREFVTRNNWGLEAEKTEMVEMDVDFLYNLAKEEAPFRSDEEFDNDSKEILFGEKSMENSKKLSYLFNNWDETKLEPIEIWKEGSFHMINDGFHRIIIAKELGVKKLKTTLKEGKFILDKAISIIDLITLLKILREVFKDQNNIDSLINELSDEKLNKEKMKRVSIGYGIY